MVRKRQKRFLSLLLSIFMIFTCMPLSADAYWVDGEWSEDELDEFEAACTWCGELLSEPEDFCECGHGRGPHCSFEFGGCAFEFHCANPHCLNTCEDEDFCDDCGLCETCYNDFSVSENVHCEDCGTCGGDICIACLEEFCDAFCDDCCREHEYHCESCGKCLTEDPDARCAESSISWGQSLCIDCCTNEGFHCSICGTHIGEPSDDGWCPCGECGTCKDCSTIKTCEKCGLVLCNNNGDDLDFICDECHYCIECAEEELKHCPICENCGNDVCESDGHHCIECCIICDGCYECVLAEDKTICEECGLCDECCRNNAEAEGCTCGQYCVEDSDFYDHICERCGNCPGTDGELCEYCGLCEDCCADNSECSEGMCVEDPDYEGHFCETCGKCSHETDLCEDCLERGESRCVECCLEYTVSVYGCTHEICSNSSYFICHYDKTAGQCREKPEHRFFHIVDGRIRSSDYCLRCGVKKNAAPKIVRQPSDQSVKVSDSKQSHWAIFYVQAICDDALSYQWYDAKGNKLTAGSNYMGVTTSHLRVSTTLCFADSDSPWVSVFDITPMFTFYCVITNTNTGETVKTETVKLSCKHNYCEYSGDNGSETFNYTYYYQNGGSMKFSSTGSKTHSLKCCGLCGSVSKHEEHIWSAWNTTKYPAYKDGSGNKFDGVAERTCIYCGTNEYRLFRYVEPHDHVWADKPVSITDTVEKKDSKTGAVTTVAVHDYHAYPCTVLGCEVHTERTQHVWGEWEIVTEANDHETGLARHTCKDCGYSETTDTPIVRHVHTFPQKDERNNWYSEEDEKYVKYYKNVHYVTCTGQVWDEELQKYVPCNAKGQSEPHNFSYDWIDGNDRVVQLRCYCRCGFDKVSIITDEGRNKPHNIYSEFGDVKVVELPDNWEKYVPKITYKDDQGKYVTVTDTSYYNYGAPYSAKDKGMPLKVIPGSVVEVTAANSYVFKDLSDWAVYTMPQNVDIGPIVKTGNTSITFIMPDYDVYVGANNAAYCTHPSAYRKLLDGSEVDPTCLKNGKEKDTVCTRCNTVITYGKDIAALGHDFEVMDDTYREPTCSGKGYEGTFECSRCGTKKRGQDISPLGHTYGYYKADKYGHWPACTVCNYGDADSKTQHTFASKKIGGVAKNVCTVCNYVENEGIRCTLSGKITSFGASTDKGTVVIKNTGTGKEVYNKSFTGYSFSYKAADLEPGYYQITVKKPDHTDLRKTVAILSSDVRTDLKVDMKLKIAGKKLTSSNKADILGNGVFSYDPDTRTLTVNGSYSYKTLNASLIEDGGMSALTVNVAKDSTLTSNGTVFSILNNRSFKLTGAGKLSAVSVNSSAVGLSNSVMTIENMIAEFTSDYRTVTGYSTGGAKLNIIGSNVTVSTTNSSKDTGAIMTLVSSGSFKGGLVMEGCNIVEPQGGKFVASTGIVCNSDGKTYAKKVVIKPDTKRFLVGDVNRDGAVTTKDLLLLKRYLANWKTYGSKIDMDLADMDNSGSVTTKDLLIMKRLLANWSKYVADYSFEKDVPDEPRHDPKV